MEARDNRKQKDVFNNTHTAVMFQARCSSGLKGDMRDMRLPKALHSYELDKVSDYFQCIKPDFSASHLSLYHIFISALLS